MAELNKVEVDLAVAGNPCLFKELRLEQGFNVHHKLTALIDFEELDVAWMEDTANLIKMIGEPVTVQMKHKNGEGSSFFNGIITNVNFVGLHGEQNYVRITGSSPTVKLAGKPTMDSFIDTTLQLAADEVVKNSGNGCEVDINPKFQGKIDYLTQNEENAFDFLNRLSWEYGEWFYFDGIKTYFGKHEGDTETIEYDKDMVNFDLGANLVPDKFNNYHYLNHDDKRIDQDNPDSVPGIRGYLQAASDKVKSIYQSKTNYPSRSAVRVKKDLEELAKAEKSRAVAEMLIMRGETQTSKVRIGGKLTVMLPQTMSVTTKQVDTFLITNIVHTVDQQGHYKNSFEGIIAGVEAIPMLQPQYHYAHPQVAKVISNKDPDNKGRVKVEFQWQEKVGKTTNWIRVQTPDAGKSDEVKSNRGMVFIPEKDDLVMVGFEYGDPSRPFVMGSIFSEKVGKGGDSDNKIKSIYTRMGSYVQLDESKGSITIKDKNGSDTKITFDGEKNIKIEADKSCDVNVGKGKCVFNMKDTGEISLTAENKIELKVGGSKYTMTPNGVAQVSDNNSIAGTNHITGGDTKIDGGNVYIN